MESKAWWASKTLWVNALSVLAGVLTAFGMDFLTADLQAEIVAIVMGGVNIALRFVTNKGLSAS